MTVTTTDRLLQAEADTYRKALIRLGCEATNGSRKTLDKATVAKIADAALEQGNELFRRAKAARLQAAD